MPVWDPNDNTSPAINRAKSLKRKGGKASLPPKSPKAGKPSRGRPSRRK